MPERKVWTEDQDRILRHLREEKGERKWANIARIMEEQFNIKGRTGKQCRQRYHNHLDSNILTSQWTPQQEELLFHLHEELGNKWSAIAQKIPGRSDNCVKNHFYSKLRKSVRKLNRIINQLYGEGHRTIKSCLLSKIIEVTEFKFRSNNKEDQQFISLCNSIKNRLYRFEVVNVEDIREDQAIQSQTLIENMESFEKDYRRKYKSSRKQQPQAQFKIYLKPPKPFMIKRQNSNGSNSSVSQEASPFLSSVSNLSSCSDLSQYQKSEKMISTNSFNISPAGSENSIDKEQQGSLKISSCAQFEKIHESLVGEDSEREDAIKEQQGRLYEYNNMFYDDTPVMARIISPVYGRMEVEGDAGLFEGKEHEEQIIYKQQKHEQ